MPAMNDPNFERTVTLICAHDEQGALGVVINRPLELRLGDVLKQVGFEDIHPKCERADDPVFGGGPVQPELGLVLHGHGHDNEASIVVSDELALSMSLEMLEAIATNTGPDNALLALGYAGWGEGQLEQEMSDNAWLSVTADANLIFDTPVDKRWSAAAERIGFDPAMLSGESGRA